MRNPKGKSSFHVGDRVRIGSGRYQLTGVIIEDRGPIGVRGRRLFGVEIPMDPFESMFTELPEEEMEIIPPGTEASTIDKQRIIEYLIYGGLISMLRANLAGGKYQPRAWLCLGHPGNVTYTFVPERGLVGGQIVPSGAVWNSKVFKPKRDLVLSFVESFGLNRQEAEKVLSEVGTASDRSAEASRKRKRARSVNEPEA